MPEAEYGFQADERRPDLRQMIAHVANSSFSYCAAARRGQPQQGGLREDEDDESRPVKALNDAVAYCDGVYGVMTDAAAMELSSRAEISCRRRATSLRTSRTTTSTTETSSLTCASKARPASTERAQQMRR